MSTPLLETKFYRTPLRPDLVARPHLLSRLDALLQPGCRLALVSAPAGFGKTTIISAWLDICECPVAFLSLDEADNEPVRFWSYVLTAFDTLTDGVGDAMIAALQSQQPPPIETLLTDLINKLNHLPFPAVFVIDDYHHVTDSGIHAGLYFLLQHLPPRLHLVIVTRSDPPWPLARMRGSGQIIELRTRDLRFSTDEVSTFLRDVKKLPLSPSAIAALDRRTEGWIASLQLLSLSLNGREDASAFVNSVSTSHHFIVDYLMQEVLERQSPDAASFLLQTSILDRICAPLCNAVTARDDASQMLKLFEADNVFIVSLDDQRRWYRYHHLFADLLRSRLKHTRTGEIADLHLRASAWYHRAGLIPEALHHALAGGDFEQAARVVEGNLMAMLDHGELKTLTEWLDKLPEDVAQAHPWLCLARAWVLVYAGEPDRAPVYLDCAERIQSDYERLGRINEARHIAGHVMAARAYQIAYQRDFQRSVDFCGEALALLPVTDAMTRCFAALLCSALLRRMGKLGNAAEILDEALHNPFLPAGSHTAVLARCNLGILRRVQGRLHEAAAIFSSIIAENTQTSVKSVDHLPPATLGLAYMGLSEVHLEWNDLKTADVLAGEGVDHGESWGSVDMLSGAYLHLARICQAAHNETGMRAALRKMLDFTREKLPNMVSTAESDCAGILLSSGDVQGAIAWADKCGLHFDDDYDFQDRKMYIILARVLLEQGQFMEAEVLLSGLREAVDHVGALSDLIRILAVQALLNDAQDNTSEAFQNLDRALGLAEQEGFMRCFLDLGARMLDLLRKFRAAQRHHPYVDVLITAESIPVAKQEVSSLSDSTTPSAVQGELIEPLSERELQVLRLLRSSMTNAEIADHLYVSVNTIRTHIRNIYEKLGVHRRLDAIASAEKLGIL